MTSSGLPDVLLRHLLPPVLDPLLEVQVEVGAVRAVEAAPVGAGGRRWCTSARLVLRPVPEQRAGDFSGWRVAGPAGAAGGGAVPPSV